MSRDTVTLFFALLAVAAELSVLLAVVLAVAGRLGTEGAAWRDDLAASVAPHALVFAFAVALTCTLGSLYLSEVAHFTPCRLCWYQRIAMYPLVPVLGLAALRRDRWIWPYGLLVAGIGGCISVYHVLVERFPATFETSVCDVTNPCSIKWVERLGYLTIPTMALSGFALIVVLMLVERSAVRGQ